MLVKSLSVNKDVIEIEFEEVFSSYKRRGTVSYNRRLKEFSSHKQDKQLIELLTPYISPFL